jgi:hypothetical protein
MSSILTSMVEIESLKVISLDNPNNNPNSSYSIRDSLKNKSTLEGYSTKISLTSNT